MRIASPLNYTGGKYKLLLQILPLFPARFFHFIDLFCGGCNVGINVCAARVTLNDKHSHLQALYHTFKTLDSAYILQEITHIIKEFGLSQSAQFGYAHYGCNSSQGLQKFNKIPFNHLKESFNGRTQKDHTYYIMLYVLIVYAFNNQVRFNSQGMFNLPVGKRDFNPNMRNKLSAFITRLQAPNYHLSNFDFRDVTNMQKGDFVYADPPYLIAHASYNEKNAWNEKDEKDLLYFLDSLHKNGVHFALSNVLYDKGQQNDILVEWLKNSTYTIHYLSHSYHNANYQRKDKTTKAQEVLITNYKK